MKINSFTTKCLLIIGVSLLSIISCIKEKRGEDGENHEALSYANGKQETGLNFALGSNGGYTLNNHANFKAVETVEKLRPYEPIPIGIKENAEALPSQTDYYDGEYGLNTLKINCKVYKDPVGCLQQAQCGWCHENNSCIVGNSMGPLDECPRSRYQFSWPGGNTLPDRVVNNDFGSTLVRTFQRRKN